MEKMNKTFKVCPLRKRSKKENIQWIIAFPYLLAGKRV